MAVNSNRRKELVRDYKLRPKPAGIYQIKNTVTGKLLLGSSLNLDGILNRHRFTLSMGSHKNKELQQDWKSYGEDAFVLEILEVVEQKQDPSFNLEDELTLLEEIWIEELKPLGDHGYNTHEQLRSA